MAQTGYTPILVYASGTATNVPLAINLTSSALGAELALNYADGKLYYKNSSGTVTLLASAAGSLGDVVGPASATDNALARFDLTTGKLIQNSVGILSDTGALSGITDIAASGSITLSGGTANGVAYLNGSKVLTTGSALVFDGANLGVGVTPSAWKSDFRAIQVGAGAAFWAPNLTNLPYAYMSSNQFYDSGNVSRYIQTNYASWYIQQAGTHIWSIAPSGTAGDPITFTQAMTLDASGNLGIGTSSPAVKLDVNGVGGALSAVNPPLQVWDTTALAANVGGGIAFGGNFTGSTKTNWAGIAGLKENATDNNYSGYMAFYTRTNGSGNAERMRLDSSGNLGIGTTSPATKLDVRGTINASDGTNGNIRAYVDGTASYLQSLNQAANAYRPLLLMGSTVLFANNGVTNATLDTSGNLGVGSSSPTAKLDISGISTSQNGLRLTASSGGNALAAFTTDTQTGEIRIGGTVAAAGAYFPAFYANGSERARIDTSGNLLVGTTTSIRPTGFQVFKEEISANTQGLFIGNVPQNFTAITTKPQSGITQYFPGYFLNDIEVVVGFIQSTTTATSYVTSSDYRLKNTITPMTGALAKVAALKPVAYKWNVDGSDGEGFIAHELAEVCPHAVTGEKDAVNEECKPVHQGVDYGKITPLLTAALQEAIAKIELLEARLASLESK